MNSYLGSHPEWFEIQRHHRGESECYAPELVLEAKKYFEVMVMIPKKKEGWESASGLMKQCSASPDTIQAYTEQFRDKYPEWFENQRADNEKLAEHYSPELVAKIIEYFQTRNKERESKK